MTVRKVHLGQEAFVLSPDGEVVRTMIAKLEEEGYRLLNGDGNRHPHWLSFRDAVLAASDRISAQRIKLREELRALAKKRRTLKTQKYRDGVMSTPYRVVDLRHETTLASRFWFELPRRARKLKKIYIPETCLLPGRVVYVVITPMTRSGSEEVYRPYKHFVLETKVTSVCFSPDGSVDYTFSTPFIVQEFFLSRKEATTKIENLLELATKGSVPFVSSKQEKGEIAKLPDDIPF